MTEDALGGLWSKPSTRREILKGAAGFSAAVGAGSILAACGSSGSTSTSAAAATGTPATAKLKRGGVLRVGVAEGSSTETQDAHTPNTDPEISWNFNLYEPVAEHNPENEFALVLAESIESKGPSEWIIRLIPGVEFHNGKTLDADDLIFTMRRIAEPKLAARGAQTMATVDLKALKKLDQRTVRIPLTAPNAVFPDAFGEYFNGIVPVGYDPKKPVGTGPFKADKFVPGQGATIVRFENYRDPKYPYVDSVEITEVTDPQARVNGLISGQFDAIAGLPGTLVSTIRGSSGLTVLDSKSGAYIPFSMHVDKKPFSDVRVRQAVRLLVNRPQMIEQALGGYGWVGNDLYSPYDPAYAKDLPQRVQDLGQAKSLLKQAGYPDLNISFAASEFFEGMVESAEVLAQQAKAAGMSITVNKLSSNAFFANYLKWPFTEGYWGTRDYLPQAAQVMLPGAPLNDTGWNDPEWTKIMIEASRTLDEGKRAEFLHAAQVIEYDRGSYVIWGFLNLTDAYSTKIGGVVPGKIGALGNYSLSRIGFVAKRVARRLAWGIATLWVVSLLVFGATLALPGNPATAILGRQANPARVAAVTKALHLDKPALEQYADWLRGIVSFDPGNSIVAQEPVTTLLSGRIVNSLWLMVVAGLVSIPLAIGLGVLLAVRRDGVVDHSLSTVTLVLAALPPFVLGIGAVVVFATQIFQWFPAISLVPAGASVWDTPNILVLPVLTLAMVVVPYVSRIMRGSMVEVLESDYVTTARLKGLSPRRVIWAHAVPNAIAPAIQATALALAYMAGGIVIIEYVFDYPGIGAALVDGVGNHDLPVVQAIVMLIASLYIVLNLVADVATYLVTPRLRTAA